MEYVWKLVWKRIEGWPDYEISNYGQVKSWRKWNKAPIPRYLKPIKYKSGYRGFSLETKYKKSKQFYAHRLVLLAFGGESPEGTECCHGDGVKNHNHIKNLRWGTRSENQLDRRRHGTELVGEKHYSSKLKEWQVLEILEKYNNGGKIFLLADEYSVARPTIAHIINGDTWKHLLGDDK